MGKQINLYVRQIDIDRITKYLKAQNFVFLKDEILITPQPIYLETLFTISERARFVTFPNNKLNYRTLEKEGTQKYRLSAVGTEALLFSLMGKMESFYHIRFYCEPYHFESNPETITDFNNAIMHFWG